MGFVATTDESVSTSEPPIDDLDRRIIYALQRDARHTATSEIAESLDIPARTVRNRIDKLGEREWSDLTSAIGSEGAGENLVVHTEDGGLIIQFSRREHEDRAAIDDSDHAAVEIHAHRPRSNGLFDRILDRVAF